MKRILTRFPEYYLIIVVLLSGYKAPFSIHPISIGLIVILTLQIIFKNKLTGLIIAILFSLINLYMLLALISEFNEFPTFNVYAKQLIFVGLFLFVLNLLVSGVMIFKYAQIYPSLQSNNPLVPIR